MRKFSILVAALLVTCAMAPAGAILFSGNGTPLGPPSGFIPITLYNTSGSPVSNAAATTAHPMALGELPVGSKYQLYDTDKTTTLTTQQDGESTWLQDGSVKNGNLALPPISFSGASKTIYAKVVSGTPNRTANLTISNITSNTDFKLVSTDLTRADGSAETGSYEFASLNYILTNCALYSTRTGYGANPKCGYRYYAYGPNLVGIHAWQYARRTSDGAFNKWIRTEIIVGLPGSGSTPCNPKCSVTTYTTQPNIYGGVSGRNPGTFDRRRVYLFNNSL